MKIFLFILLYTDLLLYGLLALVGIWYFILRACYRMYEQPFWEEGS
jgi:hypothetical protein